MSDTEYTAWSELDKLQPEHYKVLIEILSSTRPDGMATFGRAGMRVSDELRNYVQYRIQKKKVYTKRQTEKQKNKLSEDQKDAKEKITQMQKKWEEIVGQPLYRKNNTTYSLERNKIIRLLKTYTWEEIWAIWEFYCTTCTKEDRRSKYLAGTRDVRAFSDNFGQLQGDMPTTQKPTNIVPASFR
tara:strand:+ start:1461 stop:2015 length:555 start_codon:yes stop_codon:yes gene_type:complete